MYEVKDKVFLITGGAAGIGAGVSRALLEDGAKHVAILDLDINQSKKLEGELEAQFGKVKFYKCDVTTKDLDDCYDAVIKEVGYIDCVINNAGIMNESPQMFEKEIEINLLALVKCSMKAYNLMRKDRGGKGGAIFNISSVAGIKQVPCLPIYCATKTAVLQFTNCLGMEPHYSRSGVRMITICFGATDTAILQRIKYGNIDKESDEEDFIGQTQVGMYVQRLESAVKGFVEAFKRGDPGTTWLISADKPAKDISDNIRKGYEVMSQGLYDSLEIGQ